MRNIVVASHCFRCREDLLEGELVGLQEVQGCQQVFCCLCLDPRTSRLAVVHHLRQAGNAKRIRTSADSSITIDQRRPAGTGH